MKISTKFIKGVLSLAVLILCSVFFDTYLIDLKGKINKESPKKFTQGKEDNPYEAAEFRYKMLATTKDSKGKDVDVYEMREKAIEYSKQHLSSENDNSGIGWFQMGPGNIGGRIRSIVIHPVIPSHILVGAVAGGVWKTTNGGDNWTPTMDDKDPISIGCMLRDKTIPDIIYAGCGEGWGNGDAVYGGGIMKSTDFGDTWIKLPSTTGAAFFAFRNVLKMSQDDAGNIYAATKNSYTKHGGGDYTTAGGLYKSTDGGSTWSKISSPVFTDNYFNPTDVYAYSPSTILFAVNKNSVTYGGIYKTTNGGTSWTKIMLGLPVSGYRRISFAKDPSHDTIYAAFQSEDESTGGDGGLEGIYRSTNKGTSWTVVPTPPKIASTGMLSYLGKQGWYDNVIAVDPFSSLRIYVGGIDMMQTTDFGFSWSQLTYWHSSYGTPVVHADHHAIEFDYTSPGKIYVGNDGGIFRTTDGGVTWTSLNNGLFITQFFSGATFKTGTSGIYGGTQDNGHLKFSSLDTWSMVFGGDGGYSAVSQTDPMTAYEEYIHLDISKTTDGGANWFSATTGLTDAMLSSECLFIAPFSMNEISSSVLIAGSNEVWLTTDGAESWTGVGGALPSGEFISAVTVLGGSVPYRGYAGSTVGKIYKCTTLDPSLGTSNTWVEITPPASNGAWVRRINVDPADASKLIVCYSGFNIVPPFADKHIWTSSDGGGTWADKSTGLPNIPVHSIVRDPIELLTFYAGTETGIYKTTDYGITWSTFTSGMPEFVPVDEIVLQSDTYVMMAFTHGRSAFATDTPLPVELASFASTVTGNDVRLDWSTATETNNKGFSLERRTGTVMEWKEAGFIDGAGNSSNTKQYTFTDKNLSSGNYFYRIKQIDFNGSYHYYNLQNEVVVGVPEKYFLSQNYPNPFNPATKIDFQIPVESNVRITLYDISGREIKNILNEKLSGGYHTITFDASGISSGVYFYRLTANTFYATKKLMIIK